MKKKIAQIAKEDGRYSPKAVSFIYESLCYTIKKSNTESGHISAKELCLGISKLAMEKWGRLAMLVLNTSGIKNTKDIGEIVYLMVDKKLMATAPCDTQQDFDNIYDFETILRENFVF